MHAWVADYFPPHHMLFLSTASHTAAAKILAAAVSAITTKEHTYKSQHETILAELNWYMAKMCLVIILTGDTIKYMCILRLA